MKIEQFELDLEKFNTALKIRHKDSAGLKKITAAYKIINTNGQPVGIIVVSEFAHKAVQVKILRNSATKDFYMYLGEALDALKSYYDIMVFEYKQWNKRSQENLTLYNILQEHDVKFESVLKDFRGNKRTCRHHWSRK